MQRYRRALSIAVLALGTMAVGARAGSPVPPTGPPRQPAQVLPQGGDERIWEESLAWAVDLGAVPVDIDHLPRRQALPVLPGQSPQPAPAEAPAQVQQWRVDDGQPALNANLQPGQNHGLANRFDPTDFWDTDRLPPRPLKVRKIYFAVSTRGEPTGPMEWHIWEDNGGHKPDPERDIIPPFVVTGGPGENVIDLVALGKEVVIDPPRMFHVGVAHKESEATSPDVLLDDGLPYVGPTGDFHASYIYYDENCDHYTFGLLATDLRDGQGTRSPVWMIWLEVEWLPAAETRYFDQVDGGDFTGASRVAWADYDGDGWPDLLAGGSRLYHNNGDGTFTDVTQAAGITDTGNGGIWGDYDNDGDPDFFQYTPTCVPCGRQNNPDDLWRNNGDGTFTNVRDVDYGGALDAPVPMDELPTEAAAWGDFNGDGYLDLYVANHVDWDSGACFDDYLWLNNGPPAFGFRDVSQESGIRTVRLCGRGVSPGDFDDDGDLDIFVANYRLNPDLLWVNTGNDANGVPQFVNQAAARGVEGRRTAIGGSAAWGHTIGASWGDLDRDGDIDLVAARLAHSAWLCFSDVTGVYESSGPGGEYTFLNRRQEAGVAYNEVHSEPSAVDFDNDGWLDLQITHVYDGWRSSTYRNRGTVPFSFEDVTPLSGIWPRRSWGSGWADFDGDGDLDLAARGLWRNRARQDNDNHWLQVTVSGCGLSNRDGVGATVEVTAGQLALRRQVYGARGTGSQDWPVQHFGLGDITRLDQVAVRFPSGQVQTRQNVPADQRLRFVEVGAAIRASSWPQPVWRGRSVDLVADTCGAKRQLAWDLDNDGQFDDGTEAVITTTFDQVGSFPVAVKVSDGQLTTVSRVTIVVQEYIPTPTPTFTPVPWPTPGPSPTIDRSGFTSIYLPRLEMNLVIVPAAPELYPVEDPDGDGTYTVSWSAVEGAVLYLLQEDEQPLFSSPTQVYKGGKTAVELTGRTANRRYCYRVRALGVWRESAWSQAECWQPGRPQRPAR